MTMQITWRPWTAAALIVSAATLLPACAPLLLSGAVGTGVLVATDRRTAGIQLEDQGIERRAQAQLREVLGDRGRVLVHSFNRRVLLTGDLPSQTDRALAVRTVAAVENVKEIVDEIGVMASPSLTVRSSDTLVTARVMASMVDARDLSARAIKVTTERGTVYLMGRVTQREADRAADMTRTVSGVQRVVRIFEIMSEDELARIEPPRPAAVEPAPATRSGY